jgi:hypothetical protein
MLIMWEQQGPEFAELKVRAIWSDIGKIIERLERYPVGGSLLKNHPIYGDEGGDYAFLKERMGDLFLEKVLPTWNPKYAFRGWWRRFGYAALRDETNKELARTDVNLRGAYDSRKRRWRVDEMVNFSVDPVKADTYGAAGYLTAGEKTPRTRRTYRLARFLVYVGDELTSRQWREILADDEALLIADYLESEGDYGLCAFNWQMSKSGVRKKIIRVCGKAWRAIKSAQDERLGLSGIPNWDDATIELKKLEREISSAPQYARRRRTSERSDSGEPDAPPASQAEISEVYKPKPTSDARLAWGKTAARRDWERNRRLEGVSLEGQE